MISNLRILLVEDESKIRKVVKLNLEMEGYEVVTADKGDLALNIVNNQRFDLVLLDVMLPNLSGHTICQHIRLKNKDIPIIFISARDSSDDRIKGLKLGADDYLVKPFSLEELLLRVQKLIQRSRPQEIDKKYTFEFGANKVNFKTFEAIGAHDTFRLTQKEATLLQLFIDKQGEVISRQQILEFVWGYDVFPATRTIDNFILSFRKKFEEDPTNPKYFVSVRGVGYKFIV